MGHVIAEQKAKSAAWSAMMGSGVIVMLPKGDAKTHLTVIGDVCAN